MRPRPEPRPACPPGRPSPGRRLLRQLELLVPGLEEIRRHEPVAAPLALVAAFSVTAAVSLQPHLTSALPGDVGRGLSVLMWLVAVLSPVLFGGKALLLGVLVWSVLVLLGRDRRLRPLVSVFLYGEAILALHGVAIAIVLDLRGSGPVSSPESLYVPMGADLVVPGSSPLLVAVDHSTTPFHLAWMIFVAVALSRVARLSGRAAWLVAAGAWMLTLSLSLVGPLAFG